MRDKNSEVGNTEMVQFVYLLN